jgi:hypothetical protein
MLLNRRQLLGAAVVTSAGLAAAPAFASVATGSRPGLLPRAVAALRTHARYIGHRDLIGIVDFAYPSRMARFHLVDLLGGRTSTFLVSHGRGSDPGNSGWLQRFSNLPGSNA